MTRQYTDFPKFQTVLCELCDCVSIEVHGSNIIAGLCINNATLRMRGLSSCHPPDFQ